MSVTFFKQYCSRLQKLLHEHNWDTVSQLGSALFDAWENKKHVFLCGNGGSAGNAIHLANDFLYGISKTNGIGLRVTALPSNQSVVTCLSNDISYDDIFSQQLMVLGSPGDVLLALSGSGNSPNIVKAISQAKKMEIKTFAILGYSGGKCMELVDVPIHFKINDMQIAEDTQLIVGHMIMQYLSQSSTRILER